MTSEENSCRIDLLGNRRLAQGRTTSVARILNSTARAHQLRDPWYAQINVTHFDGSDLSRDQAGAAQIGSNF